MTAFAAAPDSIAGKVYRDTFEVVSLRGASEKTIIFGTDGRFVFLKFALVNFVGQQFAQGSLLLANPRGDGSYIYKKTGDLSGDVELTYDDGVKDTLTLRFTSSSEGSLWANTQFPDLTFVFSDAASVATAPAMNIAVRGRVADGQPMIAGFVVPGTRLPETANRVTSPDANQRDVLIRVVGPSLSQFGVTGVWADPDFQVFLGSTRKSGRGAYHYSDWSVIPDITGTPSVSIPTMASFRKIFNYVGAFPLLDGSKDAAEVVRLSPGAYTVVANPSAGDRGGEVLIEVYFLP